MSFKKSTAWNPKSAIAKPLRVLIIEDSEDDALLLLRELGRRGYKPVSERVETADAMKAALQKQKWDLIISDYVLPQFSGPAALEVLKESGLDLPFIIVSGKIGEDSAVASMKAGAHDYMIKGSVKRLVPAIERELREAKVRHERRRAEEELENYRCNLEDMVEKRTAELQAANERILKTLAEVKTLSGLLPICASCKNIRDDKGYWRKLESYLSEHSDAEFTHGICQDCAESLYPDIYKKGTHPDADPLEKE